MPVDSIFDRAFRRLYGRPCWGVKNCVGSDINLEFGEPHLEIREPTEANPKASKRVRELFARRWVNVRGDWRLWIWMCTWEAFQKGKRIGSDRSRSSNLDRIVFSLNGQKLVRFSMDSRGAECRFQFDLGGALVTHSSAAGPDADAEHWKLYEPSGYVLTLRNDGTFSRQRANRPADAGPWKPVSLSRSRTRRRE